MNRSLTRVASCALGLSILNGCNTQPIRETLAIESASVANKAVCCKHLSEAKRMPLPLEPADIAMTADSAQVFDFSGQRSLFLMVDLPKFEESYSLIIQSFPQGHGDRSVFHPRVSFLGEDFRERRVVDSQTMRRRGVALELQAFVNAKDAADRYLLIRSAVVGSETAHISHQQNVTPIVMGRGVASFASGQDVTVREVASPTGVIRIERQKMRTLADDQKRSR
ncbi:MAG: hypothetical protein ACRCWJ_00160 [Casimicrobium sp.]